MIKTWVNTPFASRGVEEERLARLLVLRDDRGALALPFASATLHNLSHWFYYAILKVRKSGRLSSFAAPRRRSTLFRFLDPRAFKDEAPRSKKAESFVNRLF